MSSLVACTVLVALPQAAQADEPIVRDDGTTVTYVDPALDGESTSPVRGVLREIVVEHGGEGRHDPQSILVTADGLHLPVHLDAADVDVVGAAAVAELVDGPALDAALAGEPEAPVEVAEARFETVEVRSAAVAHRAYVAIVQNSGSMAATTTIQARVDAGLAWWSAESGSVFERAGTVRYSSSLAAGATGLRCGLNSPVDLWNEAADQFPAVDFNAAGVHLVVVVDDTCSGTGIGTLGASMADGGATTLTENPSVFAATVAHELGHNVGLEHANLENVEYWDLYSPMGLAIVGTGPTALDSEYRDQLGIVDAGEVEVVPAGTAVTRTLAARGAASGLRGLEVRAGTTSHWVEWRPGTDRDARGYYREEVDGAYVSSTRKYPLGVTVSTRTTQGTGMTSLRPRVSGSTRFGAWKVGETYTSGSLTVRVDTITAEGATVTVANGVVLPEVPGSTPAITGVPKVGVVLSSVPGVWADGASLAYQWRADGAVISGATRSVYRPTAATRGKRITVRVTGSLPGHRATHRTSASTAAVAYGTLTSSTPRISGTVKVGRRLTVVRGTWTSGTAFSYRWYANGKAIKGATRTTYTPTKGVKGKRITIKVTGKRSGYTTVTRTSARTSTVR